MHTVVTLENVNLKCVTKGRGHQEIDFKGKVSQESVLGSDNYKNRMEQSIPDIKYQNTSVIRSSNNLLITVRQNLKGQ